MYGDQANVSSSPDEPSVDGLQPDVAEDELSHHPAPRRSALLSPASDGNKLQQVITDHAVMLSIVTYMT